MEETKTFVSQKDWNNLTDEQKELVKEKCPNLQIVSEEAMREIVKQNRALIIHPSPKLSDLADLKHPMPCIYDYDKQERRTRQREQMKARAQYMNKHQWKHKK